MDLLQAMKERHSVRSYTNQPISEKIQADLSALIEECNQESGLHIQLILDEPSAFAGSMAHYGKFSGVNNYLALVGPKTNNLEEKCGYYGEKNRVGCANAGAKHLLGRADLQQEKGAL